MPRPQHPIAFSPPPVALPMSRSLAPAVRSRFPLPDACAVSLCRRPQDPPMVPDRGLVSWRPDLRFRRAEGPQSLPYHLRRWQLYASRAHAPPAALHDSERVRSCARQAFVRVTLCIGPPGGVWPSYGPRMHSSDWESACNMLARTGLLRWQCRAAVVKVGCGRVLAEPARMLGMPRRRARAQTRRSGEIAR